MLYCCQSFISFMNTNPKLIKKSSDLYILKNLREEGVLSESIVVKSKKVSLFAFRSYSMFVLEKYFLFFKSVPQRTYCQV